MPESLSLKRTIALARKLGLDLQQIYFLLVLIENDCCETPFFKGLETDVFITSICMLLRQYMREYTNDYYKLSWRNDEFLEFLEDKREFSISKNKTILFELLDSLNMKGEQNYEFKRFR